MIFFAFKKILDNFMGTKVVVNDFFDDNDLGLLLNFVDRYISSDKNINTLEIIERFVKDIELDKLFLKYFILENNDYLSTYVTKFIVYFYETRYFRNIKEESQISSESSVKIVNNIKKNLLDRVLENQTRYINNNIGKKVFTVYDVYDLYIKIQNYRSDDNEVINSILEFIVLFNDENTKLGLKQIKFEDNIISITNLKSEFIPILAKGLLLNQKSYSSVFKLTSILLNGFSYIDELNNGDTPIKLVKINDIKPILNSGMVIYFLKLVNIMCKAYLFVKTYGNEQQFKAFETILKSNNTTLSQKQNSSIGILYNDNTLKSMKIETILEDVFSLPTPKTISNFFKDKELTIQDIKGINDEELVKSILEESTFDEIVKVNIKTINDFKNYKQQFPVLVEFLLSELGTSLFETIAAQFLSFPSNLGDTYITALNDLVGEVITTPSSEDLESKKNRFNFFTINIAGDILELLKVSITANDNIKQKELTNDIVNKTEKFVKSLF